MSGERQARAHANEALLVEIGLAIGSAIEIDQLLEVVMGHVTALLGAERGTLYLVDRRRGEIWSKVLQGGGLREIRLPIGSGIAGAVVSGRELLNIPDAYADARFNPEFDRASGFHTRSILCAPIFAAQSGLRAPTVPEVVGVLQVLNRVDGTPFGSEDERALSATASQLAVALENARLLAAERRKVLELDLLYGLERDLGAAKDPTALIDVALQRALELCSADAGAALLLDEAASELTFRTALGGAGPQLLRTRVPLHSGVAGRVAEDGVGRIVKDAELESPVAREIAARTGYRTRSLCAAPIASDGRILGVLELLNRRDGDFGEDDLKLLTLLGGQVGRALLRARDRDARERDERLRLLGQTLASLLHDLRSPLTIVQSYAELMADEPDPAERRKLGGQIETQLVFVQQMQREVLAWLRGEHQLLATKVHLDRFLEEVRQVVSRDLEKRGVSVEIQLEGFVQLRIDDAKLKRALFNLARNAAEAMPGGGKLTIKTARVGDRLEIAVIDTGTGMPEEVRERVFTPFFTHGKAEGTGLGLSFVKQVVEAHGGTVTLVSALGRGTSVTLSLPVG